MNLQEAISGCKSNSRQAQEWLYRTYFPALLPLCRRFSTNDDDIITYMNDGFMKVFRNIDKLQDAEKIVPWMKKIVYHTICDQLRKQKNSIRFLEIGDEDEKQMPQALEDLYEEDILALLEYIPNASAEVFVLFAIHGYGHKEIAELRNISEGTSKWHLSEARSKLKQLLLQKITNNNVNAI